MFPSDKDLITHGEDLEPEPHSERKREGQPIRNSSGKQLAHGAVKAPCVPVRTAAFAFMCVHVCGDMSVVSAVCNDRFFVWSSTSGTWAQEGLAVP